MFPQSRRVAKRNDWNKLHRYGKSYSAPVAVVKVLVARPKEMTRIGIIVGTKVSKKATVRNRVKRQLRAIVSQKMSVIRNERIIAIIARPRIESLTFSELQAVIERLFIQAKLYQ